MPVYAREYHSQGYHPAIPVADIALLSFVTEEPLVHLVAVVDTGADATMLPIDALILTDAPYFRARRMVGVTGLGQQVDTYMTIIQIGTYRIHGIKAVAMPAGSEAILGRDVLNDLEITLNGPAQELWIA